MQAKDVNGNNLTTGGLTVTMSVNGSATLSSVSDNTDGTYTATITNSTYDYWFVVHSSGWCNKAYINRIIYIRTTKGCTDRYRLNSAETCL
jgi:hypothetical protein